MALDAGDCGHGRRVLVKVRQGQSSFFFRTIIWRGTEVLKPQSQVPTPLNVTICDQLTHFTDVTIAIARAGGLTEGVPHAMDSSMAGYL